MIYPPDSNKYKGNYKKITAHEAITEYGATIEILEIAREKTIAKF